jgi:hypothetical protein
LSAHAHAGRIRAARVSRRLVRTLLIVLASGLVCACVPIGFKAQNMFAALLG